MTRKWIPFRSFHYDWLGAAAEPGAFTRLPSPVLEQMEREYSWTGVVDGEVVVCVGTSTYWPTRHTTWGLLHPVLSKPHMGWITRMAREKLDDLRGRIELTVRVDFPQGQRWAEMLGFHIETPLLKNYGPEGEDHIGYVRFN